MDELVRWLGQQLDEDERTARAASHVLRNGAHWSLDEWQGREQPHSLIAQGTAEQPVALGHFTADPVPTEQAEHIVTWDPARVLREIDAKRQALDHYARIREHTKRGDEAYVLAEGAVVKQIQIMATAYDHRPGYREEWRP